MGLNRGRAIGKAFDTPKMRFGSKPQQTPCGNPDPPEAGGRVGPVRLYSMFAAGAHPPQCPQKIFIVEISASFYDLPNANRRGAGGLSHAARPKGCGLPSPRGKGKPHFAWVWAVAKINRLRIACISTGACLQWPGHTRTRLGGTRRDQIRLRASPCARMSDNNTKRCSTSRTGTKAECPRLLPYRDPWERARPVCMRVGHVFVGEDSGSFVHRSTVPIVDLRKGHRWMRPLSAPMRVTRTPIAKTPPERNQTYSPPARKSTMLLPLH